MMVRTELQKRLAGVLRQHFPGRRLVSWDDLEGTDKIRDAFMLNVTLIESGAMNWRYALERYEVAITYFAPLDHSSVDMAMMVDKLNTLFEREFSVDGQVFFIYDKENFMRTHDLDFSFEIEYRRALKPPFNNLDVLDPNHKYEDQKLENIIDVQIVKED